LLPSIDNKNTLLVILTGLGQRKMDPTAEIHNPEMRLFNIDKLLAQASIPKCKVYPQMNPDITLDFDTELFATEGVNKLEKIRVLGKYPLFDIQQVKHQLFLECNLPPEIWTFGKKAWVSFSENNTIAPLFDFVRVSRVKDQSTAHHRDNGWL